MDRKQKYLNHHLHSNLKSFIEDLNSHISNIGEESDYYKSLSEIREIFIAVQKLISNPNLPFQSTLLLDKLASNITAINNSIVDFRNNGNVGALEAAYNQLEPLNYQLGILFLPSEKVTSEIYQNIVNNFEANIKIKKEKLEQSFNELAKEVPLTKKTVQELTDNLNSEKTRLDTIISEFQSQFSTSQETRLNKFNSDLEEWKKVFYTTKEAIEKETTELVAAIENKKAEAAKLLNIVGQITATGHYHTNANDEKDSANTWRKISFSLMLLTLAIILIPSVIAIFKDVAQITEQSFWLSTLYRALSCSFILVPALYASNESNKHRAQEVKNREFEIQISAVDPYLELIDDKALKNIVKTDLARKFFGNLEKSEKKSKWGKKDLKSLTELLESIKEIVKK